MDYVIQQKRVKISAILVILVLYTTLSTSCFFQTSTVPELKQETHEPFEDMEQYVYDVVGPDIYFNPPVIDEENNKVNINLIQYERKIDTSLFDKARSAINEYLTEHPDYCIYDYSDIVLEYQERKNLPGRDYDDYQITVCRNSFSHKGMALTRFGNEIRDFDVRYDQINVVDIFSGFGMSALSTEDDICVLDMSSRVLTYEEMVELISGHPSLQCIYIYQYDGDMNEVIQYLQDIGSDVIIFYIKEMN